MKNTTPKFNMHGYLMEFNLNTHRWVWQKWVCIEKEGFGGEKKVVCRKGSLEFMKMFPSLFSFSNETDHRTVSDREEMESELKKQGVPFVFMYQWDTQEDTPFKSVEEAHRHHNLDRYPSWDLTEYWYSYDHRMQTWAMYDTFTGGLLFTPQRLLEKEKRIPPRGTYTYRPSKELLNN